MNIALILQMAADAGGGRRALSRDGQHFTAAELLAAAGRAAARIRESGCGFVSVLDVSGPATPIALFGAAIAGVPYAPLNYRLPADHIEVLIARLRPLCLIADADRCAAHGGHPAVAAAVASEEFVAEAMTQADAEEAAFPEDPGIAVQLFTSGTTGAPKAAILRHEHLMSYILGGVEFMSADPEEAALVSVPPYHIAGISALLSGIYAGRRIVQLANFDAAAWLDLVEQEAVTSAFVVPTMLARIAEALEAGGRRNLGSLRAIAYGGGRMPVRVIERALALFPAVDFTNAYGLTETSSTITLLGPEDHRLALTSEAPEVRARLGSVGQALPGVEIEVRGPDNQPLPAGLPGEVHVRGPQVSGEYRERSAIDADGWFPTRDAGYLDGQGYLFLSGRADDVIVRGGENISPAEVEDVLLAHEAVADAAAVAAPSEQWGEAVGIAVVLKPGASATADELRELVRGRLRSSRVPETVRFVAELPYNETGKLLRREVKPWFA